MKKIKFFVSLIFLILLVIYLEKNLPVQLSQSAIDTLPHGGEYSYDTYEEFVSGMTSYSSDQGKMYYHDQGPKDGEVVVLLHGTPTNSWLYRKMITPLAANGYRVIVPDMIGFGASNKVVSSSALSTKNQVGRLLGMLESIGVSEFYVAGHDQGSLVVRDLLKNHNDSLNGVIVFNSLAYLGGFKHPSLFGKDTLITTLIAKVMGSKIIARPIMLMTMKASTTYSSGVNWKSIDGYVNPLHTGMSDTYKHFISGFDWVYKEIEDFSENLYTYTTPMIVLWGMDDPILDGSIQVEFIRQNCAHCEIHELDANHFLQEEIPTDLVGYIDGFIQGVSR